MSKISTATLGTMHNLIDKTEKGMAGCTFFEEAAQKFTDVFYQEFEESVVLVRLFATVPFGNLPPPNQAFVNRLATSQGITHLINDQTLVLSLLGTRGEKATWNSRNDSQGHVGIPLASADFIDAIPMMSRLLRELGLSLDWIDSRDTEIVAKTIGKMAGVFHVLDAKTTVDIKGRKIIAAQDFVAANNVKTVFGFGGGYTVKSMKATFITIIVFTRETIEKSQAEMFMTLANRVKASTIGIVSLGKIFAKTA